ncbi:multifunctional CCA addition/repair protein [Atopomonas sediminilitoris]|uniref:multifunctional CCA addition/repair protein n=1 Tax=Atopomonas sediminilitoris TaxID=2919919 RepID=UPI001F4E8407|nr:multifunctional CCA addition/repair protein [Atopomonas sediminilitoris]MCJ8168516.1 multifunctional CCA addition/repair protein [Atopomonas sediminilitoris]
MQIYKVGGAVRDRLLGRPVHDIDYVVVGATPAQMQAQGFRPVGADFPVFLHPKTGAEYALARTERKSGVGYGGFTFHTAADVTLEQDLIRRDLTINAMAEGDDGQLIDPYGGQADLAAKVLRHVSPAFAEDPLRVLRVARFAARFADLGFSVADETLTLMRELADSGELSALTAERVWKETARALMEPRPDVYFRTLHACGALRELLPEVAQLFGVPQPEQHHPEIDTGEHVMQVVAQSAVLNLPLPARWAALLHDLGKGTTPAAEWPRHIAHETRGLKLVKRVNARFKVPRDCQELALLVCELHTHCHRAFELRAETLLKLFQKLDLSRRSERLEGFVGACEADSRGRNELGLQPYPQADYLRAAASAYLSVSAQPLLAQGLDGAELGKALQQARLQALASFKQASGQ